MAKTSTTSTPRPCDLLRADLTARLGQEPEAEFAPFPGKARWRFDLAYPDLLLAIEIDGRGTGHHGWHATERGQRADFAKMNAAVEDGWRVLRYPSKSVATHKRRARIVDQIARVACEIFDITEAKIVLDGD